MSVLLGQVTDLSLVQTKTQELMQAVSRGQIGLARRMSGELKGLVPIDAQVVVSDDVWQGILSSIRSQRPSFSADYLLAESSLRQLLQVDLAEDVKKLVLRILADGQALLELPLEEY